jgi:hypothetical protein
MKKLEFIHVLFGKADPRGLLELEPFCLEKYLKSRNERFNWN